MLKRTISRLLLSLIVITGLAGTLKDNSISSKERKFAVGLMKESKEAVIKSTHGLSPAQLNFKASAKNGQSGNVFIILQEQKNYCGICLKAV